MNASDRYDVAVIGGGAMGCSVALHLARDGMRVALIERKGLCMEASGVNAGTLTLYTNPLNLIPYHIKAIELWKTARDWLGSDMGFRERGGLTLAFTEEETGLLEGGIAERIDLGVPAELVTGARLKEIDEAVSGNAVAACYCPLDGYADAAVTGQAFRAALTGEGVDIREGQPVNAIERDDAGHRIHVGGNVLNSSRVVVVAGIWARQLLEGLGVRLFDNMMCRVNQMAVTERMAPTLKSIVTCAAGGLTVKQTDNGTFLIGGGWQGKGDPMQGGAEIIPEHLIGNLRLAHTAVPALGKARVVRSWLGLEARYADQGPVAGAVPGASDAYVIGGVFSGWTAAPFMGRLLADQILGREPEMPLFDPARVMAPADGRNADPAPPGEPRP